jgi:hypothetical protein
MTTYDEVLLRDRQINLISRKRRRFLQKKGRLAEVRWSNQLNSYVRNRRNAK